MPPPHPRLPEGYRALVLADVDSTNAVAFAEAEKGAADGLWIVAERQTAGRGRHGRTWTSDSGNLYASLMLRDPAPPERLGELPLLAALAVHDAITDILPPSDRRRVEIKWPNDILLDGAKTAGILIEGSAGSGRQVIVIGCGINCRHHPAETAYAATDLAAAGFPTDPMALFERLADRLAAHLRAWRSLPFETIRQAWLVRVSGMGKPIRVRLPNETLEGIFEALDARGRLLLRLKNGGLDAISAGDVFLLGTLIYSSQRGNG